jgi:hypothetical protein
VQPKVVPFKIWAVLQQQSSLDNTEAVRVGG